MPLVETAASSSNNSNNEQNQREQSRERRQPRKSESEELPLTFASFYYSLKVSRGKDEREDVQKKTFAKWINSQLAKMNEPAVRDLFMDLRDGTVLIKLLELLTGKELKKEIGRMKVHHLGNVNMVLSTLREYKIRLINISANDIVEGNPKLTLGLVWNIIQHWQVRDVLSSSVYDIHTTNLEKALLTWCQNSTRGYAGVDIRNFTESWRDGLAFNALIHHYRPNLFNYDELVARRSKLSPKQFAESNLEHAFDVAHRCLEIDRLLDVEDVMADHSDKKSIMMYVMCYFQVLSKPKHMLIAGNDLSTRNNSNEQFKLSKSKSDKATLTQSFSFTNLPLTSPTNREEGSGGEEVRETVEEEDEEVENKSSSKQKVVKNSTAALSSSSSSSNSSAAEQEKGEEITATTSSGVINKTTAATTNNEDLKNAATESGVVIMSVSSSASSSAATTAATGAGSAPTAAAANATNSNSSPILEAYLADLKKVIEWLAASESVLLTQADIGNDVNLVKQQFQTHEDFMLELTKHQNNVGLVLQEGSRLINSGTISQEDDLEIRKQMKLLNDMWEQLRLQAVDRQAKLHERLMKLQTEQLNQMDAWLAHAEQRIQKIAQLPDSLEGLGEQKDELARLQDDLVKEQEAVDCLKQIIVVVDDSTDDQSFTDLENKLANLSDRWSNVCKFVGQRWFTVQDLIIKLNGIEADFDELNAWIGNKSLQLDSLIRRTQPLLKKHNLNINDKITTLQSALQHQPENGDSEAALESSMQLIRILKDIELEMQSMHAKLNDMNEVGEQIGTQLNNSPQLSQSINTKMDVLESKWNALLEQMEYLSKVCTELQQIEIIKAKIAASKPATIAETTTTTTTTTKTVEQQVESSAATVSPDGESAKKRRVQKPDDIDVEEYKRNFNTSLAQLNRTLDSVKGILGTVTTDSQGLNKDEQCDLIRKAQFEIQSNETLVDSMNLVGRSLKDDLKSKGEETSELENMIDNVNERWQQTKSYVDELTRNIERAQLARRVADELSTLRDVHEGYQKYINNAERYSNDPQKLNLQLETNKVKLKGMNSYEPRLNELKSLTNQLDTDNKELKNDVEAFAQKWFETYALIKSRNEEIDRKLNHPTTTTTAMSGSAAANSSSYQTSSSSSRIASSSAQSSTAKYISTHHHHKIDTGTSSCDKGVGGDPTNDEDVLHVVTNVYTIPIVKSSGGDSQQQQQEIHISTSTDDDFIRSSGLNNSSNRRCRERHEHVYGISGEGGGEEMGEQDYIICSPPSHLEIKKTCRETRKITKRVIEEPCSTTSNTAGDVTKSKFQIRSIVEIYENPLEAESTSICAASSTTNNSADQSTGFFKTSTQFNEFTTKETFTEPLISSSQRDARQTTIKMEESVAQSSKSYMELSQSISQWLADIERKLNADDLQLTFLPILEDRFQTFKDIQTELREKRSNLEFIQQSAEELYVSTNSSEVSAQIRADVKSLRTRYQHLSDTIGERLTRLDKMIGELRSYQEEYASVANRLKTIESNLQIEHHTTAASSYGKTLEEQLGNLKQVKSDLDATTISVNRLNERAQKYVYSSNAETKFTAKMRQDVNEVNDKLNQLRENFSKKHYGLEDALLKSNKVDNELDEIENWIAYKDHEILDDEGIIITEEQFDQRTVKYKQLKSEIDRKESSIKKLLDAGNEMLKNSTGGLSNAKELAKNLININTKWNNLNKKIDSKNRLFAQLADYINELRQLIHQENVWLEKVQEKLNSSRIGADAEEISEEYDSIERLLKSRPQRNKERINELSTLLIEKNILIQLANSDVKEFLFKWQLVHDEANKKLKTLDSAINDVQNWERRLLELQEWVNYMDKYLSTRIDQDIFADDVPDDFLRIQEEFHQNESVLKELEESVERYKVQGKSESATRLDSQLTVMRRQWADLTHKFKKFQKPADFDQKLNKVRKQLDEIDQVMYMIDLNTEDPDTIHLQLEHCMKFYKTLSELKGQIEFVLKQGRSIVDKKQVDNGEELTRQLDALKQKYNELGSRVTNGKNDLEKAFKMAKKFRKEYAIINDFLGKIDGELRKIEQKPLSKNYHDELDWIKNTKIEINKVENMNLETMRSLRRGLDELIRYKSTTTTSSKQVSGAAAKIHDLEQKVSNIQRRIDDRAAFLNDEAKKLDESYETFLTRNRQTLQLVQTLHHELIEAEKTSTTEIFDRIEREVNTLLSDVEMIRAQGSDLCSKSEQYSKVVETELRTLITNFEDLNRRLNLAQERMINTSAQQQQENMTTTVTTTATHKQSKHTQESKYLRSNRRTKSPSESSIDSTVDVFDSELKQKYMRAVAYLRILDEAPIPEQEQTQDGSSYKYEYSESTRAASRAAAADAIDIDFVIQQARQVAQMNEASNPERARRILEKVQKLEQRWTATKSKRDSLKSSAKLYEKYKEKEGNLSDQIHILEQFSIHKMKECDDDWECTPRYFYGPSDFIYENEYHCQQQQQQATFDTRSVISEPAVQRAVVVPTCAEPQTVIRKYRTTKTTTTQSTVPPVQPPPLTFDQYEVERLKASFHQAQQQYAHQQQQQIPVQRQQYRQESHMKSSTSGAATRSSSIPPPQRSAYVTSDESVQQANGGTSSRFYSSRTYSTNQAEQAAAAAAQNRTLPFNYNQQQQQSQQYQRHHSSHNMASASASCIDYNNSFYNSDWAMRHGNLYDVNAVKVETPVSINVASPTPTMIPIFSQVPAPQTTQTTTTSTTTSTNNNTQFRSNSATGFASSSQQQMKVR